jgi:hypothetical protein
LALGGLGEFCKCGRELRGLCRHGRELTGGFANRELSRGLLRGGGRYRPRGELSGLYRQAGSFIGLQDGWSGFPGENKAKEGLREERESFAGESEAWEGLQEERRSFAGASEAWEGLQESQESFIALVNSLQEQYCSSCN